MSDRVDAEFFLAELAAMITGPLGGDRTWLVGDDEAPSSKSVAAFVLHGPQPITAENTEDWLYDRYVENSTRKGYTFLGSALRSLTPNSAKDLVHVDAGSGRYVVVTALGRLPDKISTMKFKDPSTMLGKGWRADPLFAAAEITAVKEYLDDEVVRLAAPLGERILYGALDVARKRAA